MTHEPEAHPAVEAPLVLVRRRDLRLVLNLAADVIEDWDPEEHEAAQRLHVAVFGDPDDDMPERMPEDGDRTI